MITFVVSGTGPGTNSGSMTVTAFFARHLSIRDTESIERSPTRIRPESSQLSGSAGCLSCTSSANLLSMFVTGGSHEWRRVNRNESV